MDILYDWLDSKQEEIINTCIDRYCEKFALTIMRHMNDFIFITPDETDEDFTCKSICTLVSSDKVALVIINFSFIRNVELKQKMLADYKRRLEKKMFTDISEDFKDVSNQLAVFGMFHCGRIREEKL